MRHVGVGQCEVLVAALPPRADQTRMFELRQLRSGRMRRDAAPVRLPCAPRPPSRQASMRARVGSAICAAMRAKRG